MNNLTVHRGFEPGMAIMLLAAVATPAQMEQQKFAQSQQQNAQALRQYTWKSRREVRKSGEIRNVQLALMRYDIYGRCRDSALEHTAAAAADARPARSRGLIAQKKKENFMETLESGALAGYYKRASTGRKCNAS